MATVCELSKLTPKQRELPVLACASLALPRALPRATRSTSRRALCGAAASFCTTVDLELTFKAHSEATLSNLAPYTKVAADDVGRGGRVRGGGRRRGRDDVLGGGSGHPVLAW